MDPSEVKWERSFNKLQCPSHLLKSPSQNPMWPNPKRTPLLLWREQKSPCNQPTNSAERVFCFVSSFWRGLTCVHPSWPSLHSKESAICRFIDFCTSPPPPQPPKEGLKLKLYCPTKGGCLIILIHGTKNIYIFLQTWKIIIQWILPSKFK